MIRIRIEPVVHPDFVLDAEQMEKAKDVVDEVRRFWRENEERLVKSLWETDGASATSVGRPEKYPLGVVGYIAGVGS